MAFSANACTQQQTPFLLARKFCIAVITMQMVINFQKKEKGTSKTGSRES